MTIIKSTHNITYYDKTAQDLNPLPDDKILDLTKLKAFADDKLNVTQNIKGVFHRIENIVGKEENAGYQHFLLFPQCFQRAFSSRASKVVIVWERIKETTLALAKGYFMNLCGELHKKIITNK